MPRVTRHEAMTALRFVQTESDKATFPRFLVFYGDERRCVRSSWTDMADGGTSDIRSGGSCCMSWALVTIVLGTFTAAAADIIVHILGRRRESAKVCLPGEERDRRKCVRHFDSGTRWLRRRWLRRGDDTCISARSIYLTSVATSDRHCWVLRRTGRADRGRCQLLLAVRCENAAASHRSSAEVGAEFFRHAPAR